jgi:tetratricopeptide (TPR) repeat protein
VKSKAYLLLTAGAAMVVCLFLFAVTVPPKKELPEVPAAGMKAAPVSAVDFNLIVESARGTLNTGQRDSISDIDLALKETSSESRQQELLITLGDRWAETGNGLVAGKYYADAAALTNDRALLEKAGELSYFGFSTATDSLTRIFGAQQGVRVYSALSKMDSTNLDYLVREALCYIDGLGDVMQGVTILKGVEAVNPDQKEMNLILGRLSIVSGQYDKAITRLEKLTVLDPDNAEAYYHLAEAYRATGRTDEAIKSLEQCKKLVKDPAFAAQIDEYINQLKKP